MDLSGITWGGVLTDAVTMFLCLFVLGLGLLGIWTIWSKGSR